VRPLWVAVIAGAGRGRAVLVAATTALVTGLLLVAVSYARLWQSGVGDGGYQAGGRDAPLLGPIADPGTRGGSILTVVLFTVPVVLLLDQCVRLGMAAQRRRYQALAVAGATRADLRGWGALETGAPALVGAILGVVVWLLLRLLLGTAVAHTHHATMVPTSTGPGWWALPVVAGVAAYGALVGQRAGARADLDVRRERRAPKPWGLALIGLAAVLLVAGMSVESEVAYVAVVLVVLGFMGTTPWLAYVVSGRVNRRTENAAELLATRRIRADHGAAGRAAAAVGAIGLTLGVTGGFVGGTATSAEYGDVSYYVVPALLIGLLALASVALVALSLSLHSVEASLARRREMSALVATGVPVATLEDAQRAECRLVTLPFTTIAAVVGALGSIMFADGDGTLGPTLLGGLAAVLAAPIVMLLAVELATKITRPWLLKSVEVANLRTE
jgi:hypothetical protein